MINANEAKQLVAQVAEEKARKEEIARVFRQEQERKHRQYLVEETFPKLLKKAEDTIVSAIKDGEKTAIISCDDDEDGTLLDQMLTKVLREQGFTTESKAEYCPADSGTPTEGYYGHDACWVHSVKVWWG